MPEDVQLAPGSRHARDRVVLAISVAALILMNLVAIAMASLGVMQLYDQNIRGAESRSQNLALAIDLSVSAEISKIDLSLKTVRAELSRHVFDHGRRGWDEIASVLQQQKTLLPEVEGWSIVDARGDVFLSAEEIGSKRFSVADRVYFGLLQSSAADRLLIAGPLSSRSTGDEVMIFGRKIVAPDGAFGGAVVIALPVAYVNRVISGYEIGPQGGGDLASSKPRCHYPFGEGLGWQCRVESSTGAFLGILTTHRPRRSAGDLPCGNAVRRC